MAEFEDAPVVMLKSGLRVCNFSSPHAFTFTDGTVLAGCTAERSRALMLEAEEVEEPSACGRFVNVKLTFKMSEAVRIELLHLADHGEHDVLVVPLPVMQAAKAAMEDGELAARLVKLRTCRVADRVAKTVHADKFCV